MTDPNDTRPPRHCIKCGREIGPDETICGICNRAGMATPSASQYHGTMVAAIIAGVAALALAGSFALRDIGPFAAAVVSSEAVAGNRLEVVVSIHNEGERTGRGRCQLIAYDGSGRTVRSHGFVTVEIPGADEVEMTESLSGVAAEPARIAVSCEG